VSTRTPRHGKLLVHLDGALLVGGHAATPLFLDASSAKGADGRGVVPASALKGALREAVVRLENAAGRNACTVDAPCSEAPRCLACVLFGAPGRDRPAVTDGTKEGLPETADGQAGRLRIGDALLQRGRRDAWSVRPGVGVDRHTRSAAQEVLFHREVLDAPGAVLEAPVSGDLTDDELRRLDAALTLVTGIGNSRSRGLGAVRVAWKDAAAPETAPSVRLEGLRSGDSVARLVVEPLEPLVLGGARGSGSTIRCRDLIAGSALRGALAAAAARAGIATDGAPFQTTFVDPTTCLLFGDALPAHRSLAVLPLPAPRSLFRCKHADDERHQDHSTEHDTLVMLALAAPLLRQGGQWAPPRCPVPGCDLPLRPAPGGVHPPQDVVRRIATRLARDIHTGSAMQGMLYSTEQAEPDKGLRFVGTVARLGAAAREVLAAASAADVFVGRGRSRGLGRVRVSLEHSLELGSDAVAARRERFEAAVSPLFAAAAAARLPNVPSDAGGLVAVLARTDLALSPDRAPDLLLQAVLGPETGGAHVLSARQAWGSHSGWDAGHGEAPAGPRPLRPVVRAGSAWLLACTPTGRPGDDRLAELEAEGVGPLRELGLGQISFYPSVFREGLER